MSTLIQLRDDCLQVLMRKTQSEPLLMVLRKATLENSFVVD